MLHSKSNAPLNTPQTRLTLYMIGHSPDAHYLRRLLSQVSQTIDSVCFVNTDDSDDCLQVLEESGCAFEIENHIFKSRADFDFSLVRNKAREMAAKHDGWAMWLDCDDEIASCNKLIAAIDSHQSDVYGMRYDVGAQSQNLIKIRVHRAKDWRWVNKVHEELMPVNGSINDKKISLLQDVFVKHSPDDDKSNHEFHIELLKKSSDGAASDFCYIAKEHFNLGRFKEAIPWIEKTLAIHEVDIEIYNCWMMLGVSYSKIEENEKAESAFLSGLRARPQRREAYYYMSEICGRKGGSSNVKGLAYIRAANAQDDVSEPLQNGTIYNLNCYKLQARYLQSAGDYVAALETINRVEKKDDECFVIESECKSNIKN